MLNKLTMKTRLMLLAAIAVASTAASETAASGTLMSWLQTRPAARQRTSIASDLIVLMRQRLAGVIIITSLS